MTSHLLTVDDVRPSYSLPSWQSSQQRSFNLLLALKSSLQRSTKPGIQIQKAGRIWRLVDGEQDRVVPLHSEIEARIWLDQRYSG